MEFSKNVKYIGVNDHNIDLFEGQYDVPNGMAYNSYVIIDQNITVMDTVDAHFTSEWLDNLDKATNGVAPSYLVVQHMEPDHSGSIFAFTEKYPDCKIVSSSKVSQTSFTCLKASPLDFVSYIV